MADGPILEVRDEGASESMRRLPAALHRRLKSAFDLHGIRFRDAMLLRNRKGGGGTTGRTGRLRGSLGHRVDGETIADLSLRAYSAGVSYARMQEKGGTVRAKPPRRFLTIPVLDNLTAAGVPRFPSAADLRASQPGKTFVFKTKDGRLFIGRRPSANAKMQVLFRLKESVTIPPRFGFHETWEKQAPARAARNTKAVEAALADVAKETP